MALGITKAQIDTIIAKHIMNMGEFAWGCSFQPGQENEAPLMAFFDDLFGGNLAGEAGLTGRLRRLYHEAHTVALVDMRSRIERSEDDRPKKVQGPERAARFAAQKLRLGTLSIRGELEPSYALLDKVADQFEQNELRYIPMDELTTRDQELLGERKDSDMQEIFKKNKQGLLQSFPSQAQIVSDTSTDLKFKNALTRRGLAYDQSGLLTFQVHSAWVDKLFERMSDTPPPGYAPIQWDQILRADKKIWLLMADETRVTITPMPGTPRPLDVALEKFMHHPDVLNYMQPLFIGGNGAGQRGAAAAPRSGQQAADPNSKTQIKKALAKAKAAQRVQSPYAAPAAKGQAKGKGKGKGKPVGSKPIGCVNLTPDGRFVCWAFNTAAGCTRPVQNGQCSYGCHVCGKAACHGDHSMAACPLP